MRSYPADSPVNRDWCLSNWLTLALVTLLAGCSGLQTQPVSSKHDFRGNLGIDDWQLSGRIGITSSDGAHSGYLNWIQCGARYELRINGPLGSGAIKLLGDAHQVTLYEGNREPVSADSPEALLQHYGWDMPLSQLRFWIRGVPAPRSPHTDTPQGFEQAGWTLTFPRQTAVDQYTLPAKANAVAGATRVTLVVQEWLLAPACDRL